MWIGDQVVFLYLNQIKTRANNIVLFYNIIGLRRKKDAILDTALLNILITMSVLIWIYCGCLRPSRVSEWVTMFSTVCYVHTAVHHSVCDDLHTAAHHSVGDDVLYGLFCTMFCIYLKLVMLSSICFCLYMRNLHTANISKCIERRSNESLCPKMYVVYLLMSYRPYHQLWPQTNTSFRNQEQFSNIEVDASPLVCH